MLQVAEMSVRGEMELLREIVIVSFSMSGSSVSLPAAVISSDSKESLDISISRGCSRTKSKSMVQLMRCVGGQSNQNDAVFVTELHHRKRLV